MNDEMGSGRETDYDRPIGYGHGLTHEVEAAAANLADAVQGSHGCKHGRTALYWHLITVAAQHAARTHLP